MSRSHSVSDYPLQLAGVILAAITAGAVSALMLAPKSGRELRQSLVRTRQNTTTPRSAASSSRKNTKDAQAKLQATIDQVGKKTKKPIRRSASTAKSRSSKTTAKS